jgi:single-stranded DNA-binding protein
MARLRIATTSSWRDSAGERQESTGFHSVVVFGKLAEVAHQYCRKGRRVYLEARLRSREYTDAAGSSTRSSPTRCGSWAPGCITPRDSLACSMSRAERRTGRAEVRYPLSFRRLQDYVKSFFVVSSLS